MNESQEGQGAGQKGCEFFKGILGNIDTFGKFFE